MNSLQFVFLAAVAFLELASGQQVEKTTVSMTAAVPKPSWRFPVMTPELADFPYFYYGYPQVPVASSPAQVPVVSFVGESAADLMKRDGNNNGGIWFGPRMGRKKRSTSATEAQVPHDSGFDTRTLVKILHNFNWAIVPIKERRTFTPRLGRSGSSNEEAQPSHYRSQPFSPRLGRSQDDSFDIDEEKRGRNENPTQSPEDQSSSGGNAPFSPRLGRGDHFSPRLGRSGGLLDD